MRGASRPALVVVGDALLDRDVEGSVDRLSPDAPVPVLERGSERVRPGGAALAAALAAADGRRVRLVTALGADGAGRELRGALETAGVEVIDLGLDGETPEKMRLRAGGRTLLRVDRGGASDGAAAVGLVSGEARDALDGAAGVLVSDYGRGLVREPGVRDALAALGPLVPLVWDPHPLGPDPVEGALVVTPNRREAAGLCPDAPGDGLAGDAERASRLARRWRAAYVCVTLGGDGAVLAGAEGLPLALPAPQVSEGDPCGAGDRFAASLAGALADGALPSDAVAAAVAAASAFVAGGGAARAHLRPDPTPTAPAANRSAVVGLEAAQRVIAETRGRGGTVVATGGCFDLVHAGHVSTLTQARALGDCLVVCLNSDASVRRLKGPDRPVVEQSDRAAVLGALACVDAVVIFEEDTPEAVLSQLRPDLWAKGGDYAVADLPEARLLETWGGRAVVLPFLAGRSTTRIIEEMAIRAG